MLGLTDYLVITATVGCALVAGIFYAFSTFIMQALGRLTTAEGARAMQAINITVIVPWFLGLFFGTALVCIGLTIIAVPRAASLRSVLLIGGSALYVLGCVGVTGTLNVPLNNELASADPADASTASLWSRYQLRWTRWNHLRTGAAAIASVLFAIAGFVPEE